MIALLSALVGFVSSAAPEFIKLFREGKDRKHELALLTLQMQYEREKLSLEQETRRYEAQQQLEAIALQRDTAESVALNARVKESLVGVAWVDALAGTVRPVLTYVFFLMYAAVKVAQYHVLTANVLPWHSVSLSQIAVSLWTEDDMALFTAVIAFWFGQRALGRRGRMA